MAIIEDYSPITQGDTGAPFAPTFTHADGTAVNLSNATITMVMDNGQGTVRNAAGSWVIDDAVNGKAHFTYDATDVATPGTWKLDVTITIAGKPLHADTKLLQILPAPVLS